MSDTVRRLDLEAVRIRRGHFVADYTVRFESGTPTAIVGASGAGKTTLAELLSGSVTAEAGTCLLDGSQLEPSDVAGWRGELTEGSNRAGGPICVPRPQRERFAELSVLLGTAASVVDAWLTGDGCEGDLVLDLPPLSRERSIAGLAAVLSTRATVLVLDEPTMTVCTAERDRRLASVLTAMSDRIIVICSHDAEWLRSTVGRAVLIEAGRVAADTAVGDIDFGVINAATLDSTRERQGPA